MTAKNLISQLVEVPETDWGPIVAGLSYDEALSILMSWSNWARPEQLPPAGDWSTWMFRAGRGGGKTRAAAEWMNEKAMSRRCRAGLVGQTPGDVRDIMVEGISGVVTVAPPHAKPHYEPSKRRITWPNGTIATLYSGAKPEHLRGPEHDYAWIDELAAFQYARETWDNLTLGMRAGALPQTIITTTPKPISILREIEADPATVVTTASTFSNIANLPPAFIRNVISRYVGTSLGRQELFAELLDEAEFALWKRSTIEATRITVEDMPKMEMTVVAVDPAATSKESSNETGIIGAGRALLPNGEVHGYVLRDRSGRYTPNQWAVEAVKLSKQIGAYLIVAESNNGGEMVATTIHTVDPNVPVELIHASQGKQARAQPVAAQYEQGKVHHVGKFPELEDQLVGWESDSGEESPDRLDALVWAMTQILPPVPTGLRLWA